MSTLLKHRLLHLQIDSDISRIEALLDSLRQLNGIEDVVLNHLDLSVGYDLKKVNLEKVEALVHEHGVKLQSGFLAKLSRGWIHFIEENEYNNALGKGKSCRGNC